MEITAILFPRLRNQTHTLNQAGQLGVSSLKVLYLPLGKSLKKIILRVTWVLDNCDSTERKCGTSIS